MHYYKKNIGDYAKKAGRLTMLQHGAYTLLLDSCYDREQFPTLEDAIEWTWASTKEEIEAVEFVLKKFFLLIDGKYVQNRISEELEKYHANAETNKRIAIQREAKRKEKSTKREPVVNESSPNHKPLTINQEPNKTQRGTRLPTDWSLPDSWKMWAKAHRPDLNPIDVAASFYDYWISKPGAGGVKLNWEATWRNWVRSQKQSFGKPLDIAHQTTPTPANHDAALRKIEEDRKKAAKPSAEVQAKIAELLRGKA